MSCLGRSSTTMHHGHLAPGKTQLVAPPTCFALMKSTSAPPNCNWVQTARNSSHLIAVMKASVKVAYAKAFLNVINFTLDC